MYRLTGCWMGGGGLLVFVGSPILLRPDLAVRCMLGALMIVVLGTFLIGVGTGKRRSDVWAWTCITVVFVVARELVWVVPESLVWLLSFAALVLGAVWSTKLGLRRRPAEPVEQVFD